ncbi:MAG: regulatory iron-sulfur-containing complex subunit RicT [Patescibacteria group bacterium]
MKKLKLKKLQELVFRIYLMQIIEVKFTPWDKAYWFDPAGLLFNMGDQVLVHTELGTEIGEVVAILEVDEKTLKNLLTRQSGIQDNKSLKKVVRKANVVDLEKKSKHDVQKKESIQIVREYIKKHGLEMKIVDVHFSFDAGRITFAFIADGRIDFRELVKDLTHKFQKSIRFHQIGVRDEAKCFGEFGPCGQKLCCRQFLKKLGQVTGDFVECQQIAHRGGDRLSGMCGRLKCCLRFEQDLYTDLAKNLPAVNTRVRTDHGRGEIIGQNILKQSVKVRLDGDDKVIVEIPIKKDKDKEREGD